MSFSIGLTSIYSGAQANARNRWMAANFYDKVILNCNTAPPLFWPGYNQAVPLPGLDTGLRFDGITVLSDHIMGWTGNTYKWSAAGDYSTWIPLAETVSRVRSTLLAGFVQPEVGQLVTFTVNEDPTGLVPDQFLRVDYFTQTNFYQVVSIDAVAFSITAILLGLTGTSPSGTAFPILTEVNSLPANDAGEAVNAGDLINGPILQIVSQGDDGVIFKARSIQLIQFVGRENGTFATRKVITDEGMLGRYSWCRSTDEVIYFLGNRELYAYAGGQDMRPVAVQHTKQMFAELNYAEADRIIFYHYEKANEIWVVYPVFGDTTLPRRVLIYNYRWDTCTIDDYDESLGAVTAVGAWDWQTLLAWANLTETWENLASTWEDIDSDSQKQRLTIIGLAPRTTDPTINVYGQNYDRGGNAYACSCETQDYDFSDNLSFKYVDTVYFSLEVLQNFDPRPLKLFVQLGARDNLDSAIRWTTPAAMEVSGNGMQSSKVNLRASGRYIRARLFSEQVGVQWKVSSFRMLARVGASY